MPVWDLQTANKVTHHQTHGAILAKTWGSSDLPIAELGGRVFTRFSPMFHSSHWKLFQLVRFFSARSSEASESGTPTAPGLGRAAKALQLRSWPSAADAPPGTGTGAGKTTEPGGLGGQVFESPPFGIAGLWLQSEERTEFLMLVMIENWSETCS